MKVMQRKIRDKERKQECIIRTYMITFIFILAVNET